MGMYKVNRRIVLNGKAYNPGSQIDLTDAQAKEMKNGQITAIPSTVAEPVESVPAAPVKPPMPIKPVMLSKPSSTQTPAEPIKPAGPEEPTESKLSEAIATAKTSLDTAETAIAEVQTAASQETGTDENTAPVE